MAGPCTFRPRRPGSWTAPALATRTVAASSPAGWRPARSRLPRPAGRSPPARRLGRLAPFSQEPSRRPRSVWRASRPCSATPDLTGSILRSRLFATSSGSGVPHERGMSEFKLFFATDIHGSDVCWKKFINAAKFFDCQVLVMGGDMTGKMLVPIVAIGGDRYRARLAGDERTVRGDEVAHLRKLIADSGYYPYDTTPDEVEVLNANRGAVERLFQAKMTETLNRWLLIADERLARTDVRVFLGPANDDPPFVDDVLARGGRVQNPDGRLTELPEGWSMISCGWSNPTPWDTPRELPEDELLRRIDVEAARLPSMERAIFNLHVPPKDSQLDKAALLNPDLSPVMSG